MRRRASRLWLAATLLVAVPVWAGDVQQVRSAAPTDSVERAIKLIEAGEFDQAAKAVESVETKNDMIRRVSAWLEEYQQEQATRRTANREDLDKYIGYAKQRHERKEYSAALGWALAGADVAEDRDAYIRSSWLRELMTDSLAEAEKMREEHEWRDAWHIYYRVAQLYENDSRYKKLEREMLTHLRLDVMFGEDSNWQEGLKDVRWSDAETAFEYIDRLYVRQADFKAIAQAALEHMLILTESQTARTQFARLGDPIDRESFRSRLQELLTQVKAEPAYPRKDAVKVFRRVLQINDETVQIPKALLISELMRGAFTPLDDYTTMIWPAEAEEFDKHTRGDFIGVGISIIKNATDEIEVQSPLEDTPAFKAGIRPGDIITKVDGQSLKGFSLTKTVSTITGPRGSSVKLGIRRDGEELEVPLTREIIRIRSVKGIARDVEQPQKWNHWLDQDMGIGYARLNGFQNNTTEDLYNVITELQAKGMKGFVLDLRGNPGGLLTSAHEVSSLFLPKNAPVVSTKGRLPGEDQELGAAFEGAGPFPNLPLVVLVDEHSASASEIVSGALRDNHRATVIGQRTFGKFSVQNLIPLGRSSAKLKITTAKYFLPNGDSLHRDDDSKSWGVEPNIDVPLVNKEQWNVYQMRRDAERIGPVPTDKDGKPVGDDTSAKLIVEDGAVIELAGDDTTGADKSKDGKPERVFERFKIRGMDPSRVGVATEDKAPAAEGDAAKVAEGDAPKVAEGDLPAAPPVIKVGGQPAKVVARDKSGAVLKIADAKMDGDHIQVYAVNEAGEKAEVESLMIEEKLARKDTLPRLEQPDENTRPKIDPQIDAALLVMRAKLVSVDPQKMAAAAPIIEEKKSAQP
jgi:carboxyl-terminal processing protease